MCSLRFPDLFFLQLAGLQGKLMLQVVVLTIVGVKVEDGPLKAV